MAEILVSPKGKAVICLGEDIFLPAFEDWVFVDSKHRKLKAGEEGALWDPKFIRKTNFWLEMKDEVCINGRGEYPVRMGWSAGVLVNGKPIFIRFDEKHSTNPLKWSPPAGLWDERLDLLSVALKELAEELIVVFPEDKRVGFWRYQGKLLEEQWVTDYAKHLGWQVDEAKIVDVQRIKDHRNKVRFHFGKGDSHFLVSGLVAFELTGSIEGIIPMQVVGGLPQGCELRDGERLPDGAYLNRQVMIGCPSSLDLTMKAEVITRAFC